MVCEKTLCNSVKSYSKSVKPHALNNTKTLNSNGIQIVWNIAIKETYNIICLWGELVIVSAPKQDWLWKVPTLRSVKGYFSKLLVASWVFVVELILATPKLWVYLVMLVSARIKNVQAYDPNELRGKGTLRLEPHLAVRFRLVRVDPCPRGGTVGAEPCPWGFT
jgi:hypothetical protein